MLRPLTWSPVVAVCVLSVGVAAAAAGGPRPDAPPTTTPATGAPQPEAPPVAKAGLPRARPASTVRVPVAVAPAPSPAPARHVEAAARPQPRHTTTTDVVTPPQARPANEIERNQVALMRLPLVPSLHPEASDGSAGPYSLVALAAALLLLGACSLAVTVAELRRQPA